MSDARRWIAGALLVLAALGSWWLTGSVAPPDSTADPRTRHDPDYVIEQFTSWSTNERGERRHRLEAERLVHYPDDDTAHLTQPYLVQYPEDGGPPIHTRAREGLMPGDGREILMSGDVRTARGADPESAGGEILTDRMRIELDR